MEPLTSNLNAVIHGIRDIRVTEPKVLSPISEVLIAVQCVGICGSDLHLYKDGVIGIYKFDGTPTVTGHEASATVVKLGPGVKNLHVGDKVALEVTKICSNCFWCKTGRNNLCASRRTCSSPGNDGLMCQYVVHPADMCHRLPDHFSYEEGALVEPLAVVIHACNRAQIKLGQNVLICASGPIGILCSIVAKKLGASKICLTDVDERRLSMARQLNNGVCTVHVEPADTAATVVQKVTKAFGDEKLDVAFDCCLVNMTAEVAVMATRRGGTVVLVGIEDPNAVIPAQEAIFKELDIHGCILSPYCMEKAIQFLVDYPDIDLKPIVTHRFKLTECREAFETTLAHEDTKAVKVMVYCNSN